MRTLTAATARRIALAAQGFDQPRPTGRVDVRHLRRVWQQIGLLQLDSVNVFCRSHYLPMYSRLGPYPRDLLDRVSAHTAADVQRELIEYWAHEASLIPLSTYPKLRWRMQRADRDAWGGMVAIAAQFPDLVERIYQQVLAEGPIRAADTGIARPTRAAGEMWNWHQGKVALEYLFWSGRVTSARRINFERRYDVPERVVPAQLIEPGESSVAQQQRELVRIAARALGVATEPDLGDYFRLPRMESKQRVAELVTAGELEPVTVDGWRVPAYLWPAARVPRQVRARALLSPFDSLIWFRERTQRIFGFRYRLEIYTPAPKRIHGYYVLPFLLGEHLVARVDLKSDRAAKVLRVQAAFYEQQRDGVPHPYHRDEVAVELAAELVLIAGWLGLDEVAVRARGDLAATLARELKVTLHL